MKTPPGLAWLLQKSAGMALRSLLVCFVLAAGGCGTSGTGDFGGGDGDGDGDGDSGGAEGGGNGGEAGVLTAGLWDDNLNFDEYVAAVEEVFGQVVQLSSSVTDRVLIEVVDSSGAPVADADVEVIDGDQTAFIGSTASDGRIVASPSLDGFAAAEVDVQVTGPDGSQVRVAAPDGDRWTVELDSASELPATVDLAFVIDATGSMTDEMAYVLAEIADIVDQIEGTATIRLALIVYRDEGDEYVVRSFDFDDLSSFQSSLDQQSANGGGDYPEAMDSALEATRELSWRGGNVARLAFLIADAPPHDDRLSGALAAADGLRHAGVRLYPVAASGVNTAAEYVMRTAAVLTGGRYIFITDDSGVGNPHAEPTIPCYQVERLNDLLRRVIASELAGEMIPADPDEIIRTEGNYVDGRCADE